MVRGLDAHSAVGGGAHSLPGRRIPPAQVAAAAGASSVFPALHGVRAVLLDLMDDPHLRSVAADWADRVDVVTAVRHAAPGGPLDGTHALLVRPDGYVAWAAPGHSRELSDALGRWFGAPAASA
jgi:bifunctional hydroxylase/dehydrase